MAETTVHSSNRAEIWDDKVFVEATRENEFASHMGTDENAVIQVKEDLTKKRGEAITIPFVTRISGGVKGNTVLEGNETQIDNYGYRVPVEVIRNAVLVTEAEEQKAEFDIREIGRTQVKNWLKERLRGGTVDGQTTSNTHATLGEFGIIDNLLSFATSDTATPEMYRDASETNKDAWSVSNQDRLLYGAVASNYSGDHSADLAKLDSSADKLTATSLSLAKRLAKLANPRIRPISTKDGDWFIYYAHPLAMANLKADSTFATATRESWSRGSPSMSNSEGNPLIRGGDVIYDGVIVREVDDMPYISNAGDTSSDVAPGFLCGAQAMASVWAKRMKSTVNQEGGADYGFRYGLGVREMRAVRKLYANSKQWGVFTHYTYGQA
jgi:hypothetical protein